MERTRDASKPTSPPAERLLKQKEAAAISIRMAVTTGPDEAKQYADTLASVLETLASFLTAVFAPLLAFVLGYYFGEKRSGQ